MKVKIKNKEKNYSGKEKIKLYHYSKEGRFLKTWESINELRREYFPNSTRPLFESKKWNNFKYDMLPDNTFYSNYRIGRNNLLKFERIVNSKLCFYISKNNKEVEMYNLMNEKIASFKNISIASTITKEPLSNINNACNYGKEKTHTDYYFKYKHENKE